MEAHMKAEVVIKSHTRKRIFCQAIRIYVRHQSWWNKYFLLYPWLALKI